MKTAWTEKIALLEAEVTEKEKRIAELESCLNLFGDDPCWCELIVEKCAEITKFEEQIAGMRENKLYLENDLALKMDQIAVLEADNKIMAKLNDTFPLEIAKLEDEIATLTAELAEREKEIERLRKEKLRHCACEFEDGLCVSPCKFHGAENFILWAEDHYWDSLSNSKDLIVKHIKEGFYKDALKGEKEASK